MPGLMIAAVAALMAQPAPLRFVAFDHPAAGDLPRLEREAAAQGGQPWLLLAGPRLAGLSAEFFLPPDRRDGPLRRGSSVDYLYSDWAAGGRAWRMSGSRPYAQVAIAGRAFDDVRGEDDLNRPFQVSGEFSDADLGEIARFVRTAPVVADGTTIRGREWPIVSVSRGCRSDAMPQEVCVSLRINRSEWQVAVLERRGDAWSIAAVQFWIA